MEMSNVVPMEFDNGKIVIAKDDLDRAIAEASDQDFAHLRKFLTSSVKSDIFISITYSGGVFKSINRSADLDEVIADAEKTRASSAP